MKISTHKITDLSEKRPFLRASFDGGCSIPNCTCSEGKWITVSNGKKAIQVQLDDSEARGLLAALVSRKPFSLNIGEDK